MSDEDTDFNVKGIDDLLKAFKKPPMGRVGILGDKTARNNSTGKSPNNATIGAWHEFGTSKLPIRSFLRLPISALLDKRLAKAGAFDKATLDQVMRTRSFVPFVKKICIVAEAIVQDAFASNGFGTWVPHAPGYHNNTGNILVDSNQLRDSITSDVTEAS